jgi:molybdopterin-guanine dinucleotide biosynthesis protein A
MPPVETLVGVVLAGGESRRLGRDKAHLDVGGRSLAAAAAARLAAVADEVLIADRGRGVLAGGTSVPDGPGGGPAAGILGAAAARPGCPLLVLACDLPRVPRELLAELAASPAGCDWVVPRWEGGLEPLAALYRPGALAVLAERVGSGRLAPHELAGEPRLATCYLEGEALRRHGDPGTIFLNVNTPADVARLRTLGW